MSRRASRSNTNQLNSIESSNNSTSNAYNINSMDTDTTTTSNNNNEQDNNETSESIISYEQIMKQPSITSNTNNKHTPDYVIWSSLSNRLSNFRTWLEEAGCTLHPSVCMVNGEATDGTKNAPVILYGPAPPPSLLDSSNAVVGSGGSGNTTTTSNTASSANDGRCGVIDSEIDRYLWEKTLGCQIRAARELKLNDTLCTIPRHAMITADVVACSDAGRAIYECMDHYNKTPLNKNYWDDFAHVSQMLKKQLEKVNVSNGTQLLVTILRERKKAESVGTSPKYKSLEHVKQIRTGVLSSRAPLLAFLIHQRFANHVSPPVVSNSDQNSFVLDSGMRYPSDSPKTFAPYVRTFPSSLSLPIGWKRNELALLAGCITGMTVLMEVAAHTLLLSSDFCALMESGIVLRYPHIFHPDMFTWDRWIWAASCVMSRNYPFSCYLFQMEDEEQTGNSQDIVLPSLNEQIHEILKLQSPMEVLDDLGLLMPFMDMLNHERENKSVLWINPIYSQDENEALIEQHPKTICSKRIKKGNQVYSDYGTKCNQNLILQFGFAQIHNIYDDVGIGWGLMDSVGVLMTEMDAKQINIKESIVALLPSDEDIFLQPNNNVSSKWFITESQDTKTKVPFWWNEDRFYVLEQEASVKKEVVNSLKKGQRISGLAHLSTLQTITEEQEDGVITKRTEKKFIYDPVFLSIATIATASPKQISDYKETLSLKVNLGHQRRLRQFLISYFSTKLEKLLCNLEHGLCKAHYNNVLLWTKAKQGGIYYIAEEEGDASSQEQQQETYMGWSTFFDNNVYSTSIEIEKKSSYYAICADSCVLALYDGHLSALQCSLDGLLEKEVFDNNLVGQLVDMKFDVIDEEEEEEEEVEEEMEMLPIGLQEKEEEENVVKTETSTSADDASAEQHPNNSTTKTDPTSTSANNTSNISSSSSRDNRKKSKNTSDSTATNTNKTTTTTKTSKSSQHRATTITNKNIPNNNSSNPDRPPAIKLHIGNLSYSTTPSELYNFFARMYGEDNVLECHIPIERDTGKSRGFGFVTMPFLVARKALSQPSKHHEIDKRIVKIAESNTVGSIGGGNHSGSSKKRRGGSGGGPTDGPSSSSNVNHSLAAGNSFAPPGRCGKCGYRSRYCFCPSPKSSQQSHYPGNGNASSGNIAPPPPPPLRGHHPQRHPLHPPHHMQHAPSHHHHPNDIGMMGPHNHHHPNDPHYHRSSRSYDPQAPPPPPPSWRGGGGNNNALHHHSKSPIPPQSSPSRMLQQQPPHYHHPHHHPPSHHPHRSYHDDHQRGYHEDYPPNYHDDYPPSRHRHRDRDRDRDRDRHHRSSKSYTSSTSSTTSHSSSSSSSSSSTDTSTTSDNSSNNPRHHRKRRRPRGSSGNRHHHNHSRRSSSNRKESSRGASSSSRRKSSSHSHPQSAANTTATSGTPSKRNDLSLSDGTSSSSNSSRSNSKRHSKKKTRNISSSRSNNNRSSNNNNATSNSAANDRKLDDSKNKHSSSSLNTRGNNSGGGP